MELSCRKQQTPTTQEGIEKYEIYQQVSAKSHTHLYQINTPAIDIFQNDFRLLSVDLWITLSLSIFSTNPFCEL